jgi:hypothetical protein
MTTSTGTAMQGISAAIVYTAIDRITEMMNTADAAMAAAVGSEINSALRSTPARPGTSDVAYSPEYQGALSALSGADLNGEGLGIDTLPLFLDGVVGSFFEDYTGKLDHLFPGLGLAGADAQAFVSAALQSATGMSYDELVDSTPAETVYLTTQRQVYAKEREAMEAASAAGHRFAHGHALEALARMRGDSIGTATEALLRSHAARLQQEREEKMRMARAMTGESMDRIKRLHKQVADALRLQLQARGMWVNDQNAVVDAANNVYAMNAQFSERVAGLLRQTATRRFGLKFDEAAARDRDDFLGKIKMANANEVVDLFGNMVTTLMNQVSARGSYQGSERDVTDWDSILA